MTQEERNHLNWQTVAINYLVEVAKGRTVNPLPPPPPPPPADD